MDELLRKLQETRAARLKAMREAHTASADSLAAGKPKEERAAHDAAYEAAKADVAEIDVQIGQHTEQLAAEKRPRTSRPPPAPPARRRAAQAVPASR